MTLARLYRTVRPLRPEQTLGRVAYRLGRPRPSTTPAPPVRPVSGCWTPPAPRPVSLVAAHRMRFLNEAGKVAAAADWNDPGRPKLWLYNLHYFDELSAPADPARSGWRRGLIVRWIAENPMGQGNGWEPYPTSLRIVNWVKWALSGEPFDAAWRDSLALQARWLMLRLEHHLLGNHLLANAKALVFAGAFFEGEEAERWLARGLEILQRELREQILADGGHFERSPMYHAIVLEDLLDLLNVAGAYGWREAQPYVQSQGLAGPMRRWLAAMTHPDGGPSFFNDTAFGIAPTEAELGAYAGRLGLPEGVEDLGPLTVLEASGYVRLAQGEAVAILDMAPVGPDYLPGHAHADTLSFELSVGAERIVVNGGTSTYAPGERRSWERSTAAHSTVEIDGQDSSETWAAFRVGRRARPLEVAAEVSPHGLCAGAGHDGYAWLRGSPIHRRRWRMTDDQLVIEDRVEGAFETATARFHLGASVRASEDGQVGRLATGSGRSIGWRTSQPARIEPSTWAREFGKVETTQMIVARLSPGLRTEFSW